MYVRLAENCKQRIVLNSLHSITLLLQENLFGFLFTNLCLICIHMHIHMHHVKFFIICVLVPLLVTEEVATFKGDTISLKNLLLRRSNPLPCKQAGENILKMIKRSLKM